MSSPQDQDISATGQRGSDAGLRYGRNVVSSACLFAVFCSFGAGLQLSMSAVSDTPNEVMGTIYLAATPLWAACAAVARGEHWQSAGRVFITGGALLQAVFIAIAPDGVVLVGEISFVLFVLLASVIEGPGRHATAAAQVVIFAGAMGVRHYIEPRQLFLPAAEVFFGLLIPVVILALVGGIGAALIQQLQRSLQESEQRRETLAVLAKELELRNADLDHFNRAAAHDLRSPLRSIGRLVQWLSQELEGDSQGEDTDELMGMMRVQVRRMEALLDGLMDYARGNADEAPARPLAVADMIKQIIEQCDAPGFRFVVDEPMPSLTASAVLLEMALTNLIQNAVKHHDRGEGTVHISAEDKPGRVVFSITDDGPGIPEVYRAQIFEPFKRMKSSDEVEGSGLGLAIVRRLITSVGGEVAVASASPRGSTFRLSWPKSP